MNDQDWMKKFRRGRKGGCTLWLTALAATLVALLSYT
jgi:hypothetical protein